MFLVTTTAAATAAAAAAAAGVVAATGFTTGVTIAEFAVVTVVGVPDIAIVLDEVMVIVTLHLRLVYNSQREKYNSHGPYRHTCITFMYKVSSSGVHVYFKALFIGHHRGGIVIT